MKIGDVKVGMRVRCVDDSPHANEGGVHLKKGEIYTVLEASWDEVHLDGVLLRWLIERFEPVSDPITHKFHVGQPVRCDTHRFDDLDYHDIYTIQEIDQDKDGDILYFKELGNRMCYRDSFFEPAYKLEVGCKVRVVDTGNVNYDGLEGKVTGCTTNVGVLSSGITQYQFGKDNIIVLEPAPEMVETGGTSCLEGQIDRIVKHIELFGGNIMENNEKEIKELAQRMKDEYVGKDSSIGTIFLKKSGECKTERRDVIMTLTTDDIEALLKQKGMSDALGNYLINTYSPNLTVGIVKIIPIETQDNEAE